MDAERFKEIIQEYLREGLSEADKQKVDSWYRAVSSEAVNPFADAQHRDSVKKELSVGLPASQFNDNRPPRVWRRRWMSVAAAFLLLGVASLSYFYRDQIRCDIFSQTVLTELVTSPGEMRELRLPDSSLVFLSGNAKIRFDKAGFQQIRKIYLDQGEVFFEVKRDTLHPFSIETGSLSVAVLGTSFNVNNTLSLHQVAVNVKTGRVRVSGGGENQHEQILTAGKSIRYDTKKKEFSHFDVNPAHVNLWTSGGMILDGASFEELREMMLSRYGMILKTRNLDPRSFRYSLLIPQVESVDQIIKMICSIHELKFRRDKNEITLYN